MSNAEVVAQAAKTAFQHSQHISGLERINALDEIRRQLDESKADILVANKLDMEAAQVEVSAGRMSGPLLKRLDLGKGDRWESMLKGVSDVAALPDPTGKVSYASELDDDLKLYRVSCPIGVLLVIFESRPEVVVNIAALAVKSGNAAILKGGKESSRTTELLFKAIALALSKTSLPPSYIQTVQTREEVASLLKCDAFIDLVIPRGSNALVKSIQRSTCIPVMGHADGLCTVYLDETADAEKAVRVVLDSKTNYPSACNSAETLVVHTSLISTVWPTVATALLEADVQLICDPATFEALSVLSPPPSNLSTHLHPSDESTYVTEHLALTLSVIALPSLSDAIQFINDHSSHHTDSIVTESETAATAFCRGVDSAGVFVNASTRFADGFRYGFGTEVGISTGKIHARGPVGLEGLVIYKYILESQGKVGHIVDEFGVGRRPYKHAPIPSTSMEGIRFCG